MTTLTSSISVMGAGQLGLVPYGYLALSVWYKAYP